MLPCSSVATRCQTDAKRIGLFCGYVGLSYLAIVGFGLLQRIQAVESVPPDRQVSAAPLGIMPNVFTRYANLPLSFEANRGQPDGRGKFLSPGSGYALFLTRDEAVLQLEKSSVVSDRSSVGARQKASVAPTFRACAEPCEGSVDARVAQHPPFGAAALPDFLSLSMPKEGADNEVEKPRGRRAGPAPHLLPVPAG